MFLPVSTETKISPAGSRRSAGLLCSGWWSHCRWLLPRNLQLEEKQTKLSQKPTSAEVSLISIVVVMIHMWVSPRCVICSGIWTGICSAATELGAGLLPLSSNRVRRIWSEEEEEGLPGPDPVCCDDSITSWRPFSRTDTHTHTHTHVFCCSL